MPQSTKEIIAERRARVASYYLQGKYQADIARLVGVKQQQISQDLAAIRKDWETSALVDFNEAKAKELAKIDLLEQTYWDAWFKSLEPIKKSTKKMSGKVDKAKGATGQLPSTFDTTDVVEQRLGDPRYLDGIQKCIQKRCELLGLDAPLRIAETDVEGKGIMRRTWVIQDNTASGRVPAPDEEY